MVRGSDGDQLKLWRDRFGRCAKSELTIGEFCAREGIATATYYYWRKKLASSAGRRKSAHRPVFQPVLVTPSLSALLVRLPGGAELEVPRENLEAVRAVVAELVRTQYDLAAGDAPC